MTLDRRQVLKGIPVLLGSLFIPKKLLAKEKKTMFSGDIITSKEDEHAFLGISLHYKGKHFGRTLKFNKEQITPELLEHTLEAWAREFKKPYTSLGKHLYKRDIENS